MTNPLHPTFSEAVGAVLALLALAIVAYAAVIFKNEQALGSLIGVVAAAVGFFLRGRVAQPTP